MTIRAFRVWEWASAICRDSLGAKSRSISPENPTGEKGRGGMAEDGTGAVHARGLGRGWKISPSRRVAPGETLLLGAIEGAGAIQQIWITPANVRWRDLILRVYWDEQEHPSVEAPLGDFFACGWGRYAQVSSLAVCVNPGRAFNCYWEMPFRRGARLTLENRDPDSEAVIYWQINYALTDVPEDAAYFHAQFRRTNPLPFKQDYVDARRRPRARPLRRNLCRLGRQQLRLVGRGRDQVLPRRRRMADDLRHRNRGLFLRRLQFRRRHGRSQSSPRAYIEFTTPYSGLPQVIRPDGTYQSQQRFGLYRWHIMDPIRFETDLSVTLQAIGWRTEKDNRRYLPLQDDIASVAYWYQTLPAAPFPALPDRDYLEII